MADVMKRDTTGEIRAAVEDFFKREDVKHIPFDDHNVAVAVYSVEAKFGQVRIFFLANKDRLVLRMILPINVGEEEREKVAEFLLRANYGLKVGGFDFDCDDGEISFRISIFCGINDFTPPTYEQIDFSVVVGLMMIEKYGDALGKVIFGLLEPKEAIASAEADD